jgi:chemotaxis protein CheC
VYGRGVEFFSLAPPPDVADGVLFIYINFVVRERDITGYIAMLLDLPSLITLKDMLGRFIERVGEENLVTRSHAS